jgi:iron complex outermembrane receptor protein
MTMNKATTYRLGAKLSQPFELGGLPWDWEAGAFQSQFRTVKDGTGNALLPAVQKATGASWFNPATNRYECGSAANPITYGSNYGAGQCIPWNPLAPYGANVAGSLADPELQKFLFPIGHDVGETETNSLFANVSGVLAELDAGELGFAAGYEHRQEKGFFSPDALRQSGLSTDLGSGNSGGQYHLDELYAEVNIPLAARQAFRQCARTQSCVALFELQHLRFDDAQQGEHRMAPDRGPAGARHVGPGLPRAHHR